MRGRGNAIASILLCACSTPTAPSAPEAGVRVEVESEVVLAPREPTPAFAPAHAGACPAGYRLVEGSCVHQTYVVDEATLSRALADYQRGARPPMLGPVPPKAPAREPAKPRTLDPGALTERRADAGAAQQRRLAELDALIAAAKEKLRQRDEASKAHHVDNPPRRAPGGTAQAPLAAAPFVGGALPAQAGAATSPNPTNAADPTQARIVELTQLASQLPPEQLQAIAAQFGRSGMDMHEIEAALSTQSAPAAGK